MADTAYSMAVYTCENHLFQTEECF
jgi:hypothetical protein